VRLNFLWYFYGKKKIGGYKDLVALSQSGEIKRLLESSELSEERKDTYDEEDDDKALQLGVVGRTLEGVETVVSYLNPLSWLRRGSKSAHSPSNSHLDFDIVHTNWYSRRLRRKLRFLDQVFVRIHPKHGDIRAAHKYSEIDFITMTDSTTLVFNYTTGASPDWIQCTPHDLPVILNILKQKVPDRNICNSKHVSV